MLELLSCQILQSKEQMKKEHLPEKICTVCGRPFKWRKKWQKNWEQVVYCSERCRRNKNVQ